MRPQIVKKLTLILCTLMGAPVLAQQFGGASAPPVPDSSHLPPPPPELPIDSGLTLLLIAGLVYGTYFMWKKFGLSRDVP